MEIPIATGPSLPELLEAARGLLNSERLGEAQAVLRRIVLLETGEASDEAIADYRAALRLALDLADVCCDRCERLIHDNQLEEGLASQAMAEELKVDIAHLHDRLGDVHLRLWQFEDAIIAYRVAARLQPDFEPAARKLQEVIEKQKQPEQVLAACRAHVERTGGSAAARFQLANALREYRRLDEAIDEYQRVIELQPDSPAARNNLAIALADCGQIEDSQAVLRGAAELELGSFTIQSNLLYGMYFHPADDGQAILREHLAFDERLTRSLTRKARAHDNDRSPDRVLRIAYVSPDFREHCQSFFTIPLLANHDRTRFEIFCYADVSRPDGLTDRLRGYSHVWRDTLGRSDQWVADCIRSDRIDILVDLTMHMSNSRPALFARKPAPIQIAWLAYPGTTGLSAMDYRLSDPYLDPPGVNDADYSEQTVRLPDTFWSYDPLVPAVSVATLPASRNGHITFGCLNNFRKVTDQTLAMWRKVLRRIHDAHLALLAPVGKHRRRVLTALGVDEYRVHFVDYHPRPEYLKLYDQIDICLDTFPYNGHTTSLDAIWMGVPVISLYGRTAVARAGWSHASNLKLTHLVGATPEAFVEIATSLGRNWNELAELRSTLRERMSASPLMDAGRFARNVESIYRDLWRRWCTPH